MSSSTTRLRSLISTDPITEQQKVARVTIVEGTIRATGVTEQI